MEKKPRDAIRKPVKLIQKSGASRKSNFYQQKAKKNGSKRPKNLKKKKAFGLGKKIFLWGRF